MVKYLYDFFVSSLGSLRGKLVYISWVNIVVGILEEGLGIAMFCYVVVIVVVVINYRLVIISL